MERFAQDLFQPFAQWLRRTAPQARGGGGRRHQCWRRFGTFSAAAWSNGLITHTLRLEHLEADLKPLLSDLGLPGTITVPWSASEFDAYSGVTGDVVWNNEEQRGYLRLAGMPVNDPSVRQYQLWIVDPSRDEKPVDGGVFDIPAGAEPVIIPIDAKLPISEPVLFAVTREKPGGVVVSGGPLLLVTERNL